MKPRINASPKRSVLGRGVISAAVVGAFSFVAAFTSPVQAQEPKHLTLQEAIELGVQNSKVLRLSQTKIDQALIKYSQVKDEALPKASASYTYNHAEIPTKVFQMSKEGQPFYLPKRADAFLGTLSVQEVIFAGNKLKYAKESAELMAQVARLDAEKDKEEIAYHVTSGYFNLYKLQQSQKVVAQNLQAVDRQIKQAQRFFEQGIVTKNDVLRFQLQRSNVELTGADLETNRKIVVYNLNILLGLPENNNLVVEEVASPAGQNISLASLVDSAMANREELQTLSLQNQAADNNIKSIKADALPALVASADGYHINPSGSFIPPAHGSLTIGTVGLTAAWNFDRLWTNKNKLSEANIQKTQLNLTRDLTTDQLKTEVNQNYQRYLLALDRIKILQTAIAQAEENDRSEASRYTNKVASATDRIDAQTRLYQALINLELARADAGLAYYTLLKSTGTILN
ncbi:TolC family protein [Nibribacter ruber]|uniref:TolC family protein n=1 Tax=Nibribacter ruber TaxID=2698458 RepID=A0A6P1NX64_9BACT|nr:TolC family protein [Nibribacter ruber]QHL86508.1 TolC family protein [Nibribacter ruber]